MTSIITLAIIWLICSLLVLGLNPGWFFGLLIIIGFVRLQMVAKATSIAGLCRGTRTIGWIQGFFIGSIIWFVDDAFWKKLFMYLSFSISFTCLISADKIRWDLRTPKFKAWVKSKFLDITHSPTRTDWYFGLGIPLLLAALILQNVTLSSQHYAGVLVAALVLVLLADFCFVQAFRRGGLVARCFSVSLLLPTLFVLADFIRRAPSSFGH